MRCQPRQLMALAAALLALTAGCSGDDPDSDDGSTDPTSATPSATLFSPPSGPIKATRFSPREDLILARIPTGTGTGPSGISLGHGSVWVTAHRSGELLRINPKTHKIVARIQLPAAAGFIEGAALITPSRVLVCVFGETTSTVASVDPGTNRVRTRPLPCDSLEHGELGTWLSAADRLTQIDPVSLRTLRVLRPKRLPTPLTGDLLQADGSLWGSSAGDIGELYRIDPRSGAVLGHWFFGDGTFTMARIGKRIYFTNPSADEVSVVDATTNKVTRTKSVPGSDDGDPILTAGHGQLWASTFNGGLARLDPETLKVMASGQLGSQDYVGEVAVGKGRIWFPTYGGDTVLEVRSRF